MLLLLSLLPAYVLASATKFDGLFNETLTGIQNSLKNQDPEKVSRLLEAIKAEKEFFQKQKFEENEDNNLKRWSPTHQISNVRDFFATRMIQHYNSLNPGNQEMIRECLTDFLQTNFYLSTLQAVQACPSFGNTDIGTSRPGLGVVIKFKPSELFKEIRDLNKEEFILRSKDDSVQISALLIELKVAEKKDSIRFPPNFFDVLKKLLDWKIKEFDVKSFQSEFTSEINLNGYYYPSEFGVKVKLDNSAVFKSLKDKIRVLNEGFIIGIAKKLNEKKVSTEYKDQVLKNNEITITTLDSKSDSSAYMKIGLLKSGDSAYDNMKILINKERSLETSSPTFETEVNKERTHRNTERISAFIKVALKVQKDGIKKLSETEITNTEEVKKFLECIKQGKNVAPYRYDVVQQWCKSVLNSKCFQFPSTTDKKLESQAIECVIQDSNRLLYFEEIN